MEGIERSDVLATHHKIQAMYHLMTSMIYAGIVKDEAEFREKYLLPFEMVADGVIQDSKETIDELTVEAREKLKKIYDR